MKNKKKHHTDGIVPQKSNKKSLHRGKIDTPDTSKKHKILYEYRMICLQPLC